MSASIPPADGRELLSRLDRLPLSKPHRRLILQGGMGYMFESFDGVLLGYAAAAVVALWGLDSGMAGWVLSSVFIGFFIGSLLAGALADRIGRRRVLMYALLVYVVFTILAATSSSPGELITWRILGGIGIGAEATTIVPYVAEFLPKRNRGRSIGGTMMFLGVGNLVAALAAVLVISPHPQVGWRIGCVIGVLPVLLLLWWRRSMSESPRYLIGRGRLAEAAEVVERFERESAAAGATVESAPSEDTSRRESESAGAAHQELRLPNRLAALWRNGMAGRTAVVCLLWFTFQAAHYGYVTWLPNLLVMKGFSIANSFLFSMLGAIAQLPGYYTAGVISEWIDRKWAIVVFMVGSVACAAGLGTANSDATILCFIVALAFFVNGAAAPLYTYTAEIYPTDTRATGMGLGSAVARVGSVAAPVSIGYLYTDLGFSGVFIMLSLLLLLGAGVLAAFGRRTALHSLEDLHRPNTGSEFPGHTKFSDDTGLSDNTPTTDSPTPGH